MAYGRRVVLSSPGLKYMREKSVCLCVLTRHAWPAFFRVALRRMVERLESERGWAAVEELAAAIRAAPLPDRGCHLIVQVPAPPPPATAVVVESENESESESEDSAKNECPGDGPEAEKEAPTVAVTLGRRPRDLLRPATESAQDLFQCLGSGGLVNVVVAALLERRVLVVGASMDRVSRAVLAICGLLYPFRWQHICVTLLVPQLLDYVYSPIPYILGIQRYHYEAVRSVLDDVVVVDLDAGTVTNATNYGAPEAVLLTSSGGSGGSYSGNSVAADPSMYPHVVAFRQSLFSVPPSSSSLLLRRKAGGNNSNNNGGLSDEKMGGGGGNKEDDDDDDDEDGGDERDSIGSRFCKFLAKTVGHYDMFFRREPFPMEGAGEKMRLFDTKTFLKFHSKSEKRFLKNFVNSQMFEQFIQEKEAELTDKGFLVRTQFDVDVDAGKKEPVGDGIHLYSAKLFKRVAFSDPVPPPRPPKPKFLTLNH